MQLWERVSHITGPDPPRRQQALLAQPLQRGSKWQGPTKSPSVFQDSGLARRRDGSFTWTPLVRLWRPVTDLRRGTKYNLPPFQVLLPGLMIKLIWDRLTGDNVQSLLQCICGGCIRVWHPKCIGQLTVPCHFGQRRREEGRGPGFKKKSRQFTKKSKHVNKFLVDHPETVGHRAKSNKQALLDFSQCATCSLYCDAPFLQAGSSIWIPLGR